MGCVAVIPARRAERTIRVTLEALRLGNAGFVERVVVVSSDADPTAAVVREWSSCDPRVELLATTVPLLAGTARNLGRAAAADASLLLFVDADCRLERGGAARLERERRCRGAAALSARVIASRGIVARLRHLLEFKEAASARPAPEAWLPPSTTLLCGAGDFDRAGGFPDMWPGEDLVFSQSLRELGARVLRSDRVTTLHEHPPGLAEALRHQWRLGWTAAVARRSRPMPGSAFAASVPRALLLFPGRLLRFAAWQLREGPREALVGAAMSPLVVAGLACWTAGFVSALRAAGRPPVRRGVEVHA